MAQESPVRVAVKVFRGMSTDADPNDRPPGLAVLSVNCESHDPGVLRPRRGTKPVTFENDP